jgi:hypothetical protein
MPNPGPAPDHNLKLRTYIEEAATRSMELRQVIDRIVELRPHDKSIQNLDQIADVLMAKLSALSIRVARSSGRPVSAMKTK